MDRLDAMQALVAAVDHGSLAAAARKLGRSAASVTRAVAMLEERLGMRLLHRSTRALHLTPFGESYVITCRDVLAALAGAERGAAVEQEVPSGLLMITAPLMFGTLHVRPVLDAFLDENPAVQARLLLVDRVVNLIEEGLDIAVRLAHLPDSQMLATRLGEVRRVVCAAESYLARRGVPHEPADLRAHDCIMERDGAETDLWRFGPGPAAGGRPASIALRPRLIINSAAAAIESAVAGHGITRVLSYQVAEPVAQGRLVVLLAEYEPPPIPVHFVLPPARSGIAKLRAFVSFAAPRLKHELAEAAQRVSR